MALKWVPDMSALRAGEPPGPEKTLRGKEEL
jgi:hypothetical protein